MPYGAILVSYKVTKLQTGSHVVCDLVKKYNKGLTSSLIMSVVANDVTRERLMSKGQKKWPMGHKKQYVKIVSCR